MKIENEKSRLLAWYTNRQMSEETLLTNASEIHLNQYLSQGPHSVFDPIAYTISLHRDHYLNTEFLKSYISNYLLKDFSVTQSLFVMYPFLLYFALITFSLVFFALKERVIRQSGYVLSNRGAGVSPLFFRNLKFILRRKNFCFSNYSLINYLGVVKLNILTFTAYVFLRKSLLFFIFLLLYHFFFVPYCGLISLKYLNWDYFTPDYPPVSCSYLYYIYFFLSLQSDLTFFTLFQNGYSLFYNHFGINNFLLFLIIIFLGLTLYLLYAMQKMIIYELVCNYEYSVLLAYNIFSQILLLLCTNFFTFLILVEIFSYTLYVLIALRKQISFKLISTGSKNIYLNNPLATEASMKYFLYGALNSLFFIIALIFLLIPNYDLTYNNFSYYFFLIAQSATLEPIGIFFAVFFILFFLLFKLGAFPFHWWLPDVFTGTSFFLISYIALPVKFVFVTIFIFFMYGIFLEYYQWSLLVICFSLIGMLWGAIGMLRQRQLKRFFAYSTINHLSYILFGLTIPAYVSFIRKTSYSQLSLYPEELHLDNYPQQLSMPSLFFDWNIDPMFLDDIIENSITASVIYLVGYIIMMLLLFTLLSFLQKSEYRFGYLSQFLLLGSDYGKVYRLVLFLLLMSLIGVPPLIGFWGKYYLFYLSIKITLLPKILFSSLIASLSPLIIILSSVISAFGYLLLFRNLFFRDSSQN